MTNTIYLFPHVSKVQIILSQIKWLPDALSVGLLTPKPVHINPWYTVTWIFETDLARCNRFYYSLYYHHTNVIFQTVFSTTACMQCAVYQSGRVRLSRYKPGVAQRVGRGIALLFHDRGTRRGWVVSSTPQPHFTPGKDLVPILQEAGWAPGPVWTGGKFRPHRDSIPDRYNRSLISSLARLFGSTPHS